MTRKKRPWAILAAPVLIIGPLSLVIATASPASAATQSETISKTFSGKIPKPPSGGDTVLYGADVFQCSGDHPWVEGEPNDRTRVRVLDESAKGVIVSVSPKQTKQFSKWHYVVESANVSTGSRPGGPGGLEYKVTVYCTSVLDNAWGENLEKYTS